MNYTSIWNIIPLSYEEKIFSLLTCNNFVSLNEFVNNFFFQDYFDTAKEMEILIEKGYVRPIGEGKFELSDSKEVIKMKLSIRKKILAIIRDLLLEINEKKNDTDYNFNLFSDLEKLWGNWMRDDLNVVYSAVKKNLQSEIRERLQLD
ncbi:MAG: hypothetical protein HeimC3_35200 [Candidatus Heimdallarchaeota archaeon LC_3]|nr:MAG: hypothetical protein HeimC3_35200 [Candidatus Heimdallarchaeota archaeon LC_3]